MAFILTGVNYRETPVGLRERLDFSKREKESCYSKLRERTFLRSGLVLSTCNRVEVYATGDDERALSEDVVNFLCCFHDVVVEEVTPYLYCKENRAAVQHLFRVSAGLDSMVLGEPQILGQVKEAYFDAVEQGCSDPFLDRLMRKAFSVAKRIRTETGIGQQAVSVGFAAVELARKVFGELAGKRSLVLGAGEMAERTAEHLAQRNVKQIVFANRSYDHSVELARAFNGIPVPLDRFSQYLKDSDIVIVSTAAPHYLISRDQMEKAVNARKQSPIFVIDISVPRNVDPEVDDLENVYLYNIDDLQGIVQSNLKTRASEAEKAESIIASEVDRFFSSLGSLRMTPVITSLQAKYEKVRQAELQRMEKKLVGLSQEQKDEIDRGFQCLVRKILNEPILFLKDPQGRQMEDERSETLREVFRLSSDEGEENS